MSQLLLLDNQDASKDIKMFINSPGAKKELSTCTCARVRRGAGEIVFGSALGCAPARGVIIPTGTTDTHWNTNYISKLLMRRHPETHAGIRTYVLCACEPQDIGAALRACFQSCPGDSMQQPHHSCACACAKHAPNKASLGPRS